MQSPRIQRALISVSDKLGLADFARGLVAAGVEIYSTGGTRKHLESEGIPVRDVSDYTGFPEMMDGRLKTLHPKVHGGILCRHDNPEDMQALAEHGILTFELVVVNLYPFEATVARPGVTLERGHRADRHRRADAGPRGGQEPRLHDHRHRRRSSTPRSSSRSTAHGCTTPGAAPPAGRRGLRPHGPLRPGDRRLLRRRDGRGAVPRHAHAGLAAQGGAPLRREPAPAGGRLRPARARPAPTWSRARQLHGKELSYNNLLDLDSALAIVRDFAEPAAVGDQAQQSLRRGRGRHAWPRPSAAAHGRRSASAFGSVLGLNRTVDAATAEVLAEPGLFVEAIVAPDFEPGRPGDPHHQAQVEGQRAAAEGRATSIAPAPALGLSLHRRRRAGAGRRRPARSRRPSGRWSPRPSPADAQLADLRFAWAMVRHVKSNAIVLCKDRMLLGRRGGADEPRRFGRDRHQEGGRPRAAVRSMASDAFFPFPDSIEAAAAAGVAAIIQPGGSRNDDEVIAACNHHGLPMIFTGRRHFKH